MVNITSFEEFFDYVNATSLEDLLHNSFVNFFAQLGFSICDKQLEDLISDFDSYEFGQFLPKASYFTKAITDLKQNLANYEYVYCKLLSDTASKDAFLHLLLARLLISAEEAGKAYTHYQSQYFQDELFSFFPGEVMMDCGGYIGDTTLEFIQAHPDFKRIHVFEASAVVMERTKENLHEFCADGSVVLHKNAIGNTNRQVSFCEGTEKGDGKVAVNTTETQTVTEVRIDDFPEEYVSIIKMDIEGYERNGLLGATKTIQRDTPKLMISLYHCADDLWQLPILIESINPNYKFFIRHVRKFQFYSTVLYCVPITAPTFSPANVDQEKVRSRIEKVNHFCIVPTEEDEGINSNEYYEYLLYLTKCCSINKNALAQRSTDVATLEAALNQRNTDVATLEAALNQRNTDVATLEAALSQRSAEVTASEEMLAQKTQEVQELKQREELMQETLETQEDQLCTQREQISRLQYRILDIEATWSYRIGVKLKNFYNRLFRSGT